MSKSTNTAWCYRHKKKQLLGLFAQRYRVDRPMTIRGRRHIFLRSRRTRWQVPTACGLTQTQTQTQLA
jgi:hypothetical protein